MKLLNIKNKITNILKNKLFKNMLIYTILFCVLVLIMIYIFRINGKNFIWDNDGIKQHILTLYSYRNLLIQFFKTGSFNTFSWNIGLSMDLFANYAYYIFGDFFSIFSVFVSEKNIFTFYSLIVLVRLYFSGVSFLIYCNYRKLKRVYTIIGALMYVFCSFSLFASVRHPYMINAMLITPILFLSIDRAICENKYTFFAFSIALLYVISFYFGYMLSIIIGIYGIVSIIYNEISKNSKVLGKKVFIKILKKILIILGYSLLGIGMACIVLIPTLNLYVNSERSTILTIYPYSISYYKSFLSNIITTNSPGYWVYIGVQSLILLTLPIFVKRRKLDIPKFALLLAFIFPLAIPQIGSIFCGFSFPNNRWCFVVCFIFAYISVLVLDNIDDERLNIKDLILVVLCLAIYFFVNAIVDISLSKIIVFQFSILCIIILLILTKDIINKKIKFLYEFLFLIVFTSGLAYTICYKYDIFGGNYVSGFTSSDNFATILSSANNKIDGFDNAIEYIKSIDNTFYRIEKYPDNYENISLYYDFNSIGSYYSISPTNIYRLSDDLSNSNYQMSYGLKDFDYRTKILSLLGVKYIISTDENYVPYGYTLLEYYDGTASIYVNENYTSFATLYTSYITTEDYEELSSLEKETILIEQNALDEPVIGTYDLEVSEVNDTSETITSLDYEITDTYNILEDNTITITSTSKNKIVLTIDDYEDSEIYVSIKGLSYEPYSKEEMINNSLTEESSKYDIRKATYNYKWYQESYAYTIAVSSGSIKKSVSIYDYKTSPYYLERDELLFNLGYDNSNGTITIILNNTGTYTFDSIEVYAISMSGGGCSYQQDISKLNESNFDLIEYDDNYMIATVNPTSDGVLQFATYYNDGWDVYVDGEKVDTFESNTYFLGIYITEGEHTIELRYHTPYVKEGLIVSGICLVVTASIHIISKKRKKGVNAKQYES